jgi:hypothetical protein
MKYITLSSLIYLILSATSMMASRTKVAKIIARNLKKELESFEESHPKDQALNKQLVHMSGDNTSFYLDTFKIRIIPFIEFKLPGIASLRVRPRFALIYGRALPKGWKKYSL